MDEQQGKRDYVGLIRRVVEMAMPDLRHYYKMPRKGRVVAVYASDGQYFADVQPLRNDESEDPKEPVVPRVPIPVTWGGPDRGVVCPPQVGVLCDLMYYDGDPNFPCISNIRWGGGNNAPRAELNEFVIQLENGVEIRIDRKRHIVTLTPESIRSEAGRDWIVRVGGDATIEVTGDAAITAGRDARVSAAHESTLAAGAAVTIAAPVICLLGRLVSRSWDGGRGYAEFEGDVVIRGDETIRGNNVIEQNIDIGGKSSVAGDAAFGSDLAVAGNAKTGGDSRIEGDSWAATRSGGRCCSDGGG